MTALADARAHLVKAREFLEAARSSNELDRFNAATSDAVISAINSKDAIRLRLMGVTRKSRASGGGCRAEVRGAGRHGVRVHVQPSVEAEDQVSVPVGLRRGNRCDQGDRVGSTNVGGRGQGELVPLTKPPT